MTTDFLLKGFDAEDGSGGNRLLASATGFCIVGLIWAAISYRHWQNALVVGIGLIVQLIGCVLFEALLGRVSAPKQKPLRRRFYLINLWFLLPIPICGSVYAFYSIYPFARSSLTDLFTALLAYLILSISAFLILKKKR